MEVRRNFIRVPNMKSVTGYTALTGVAAPAFAASALFGGSNRGIAIGNNTSLDPRVQYSLTGLTLKLGELWTFQHKIKKVGTWPAGGNVYPAIRWQLTAGGEVLSVNSVPYVENGSGWMQCSTTVRVPAGVNGNVLFNIGFLGLPTFLQATGDVGWADVCFERGGLKTYFDGSTVNTALNKYTWAGAVDASESINSQEVSRTDDMFTRLRDQGFTGSINDMEHSRLLLGAGLVEPQSLSLADLYRLNNERPRL